MLTAIIFILVISLILALSLSLMRDTTQKTTNRYLYEQAQLLARSATEYAVMAAQAQDIGNCLRKIDMQYQNIYDINISLHYFGNGLPASCPILANDVGHKESNSSVLIDVWVHLKPNIAQEENPISYLRRTLQKL